MCGLDIISAWLSTIKGTVSSLSTPLNSAAGRSRPGSILNSLASDSRRSDLGLGLVERVSLLVVVLVNFATFPRCIKMTR